MCRKMTDYTMLLRISLIWLLFFITHKFSSSAQPDFISIDCGGVGTTPYMDASTEIQWQTDEALMTMGLISTIKDPTLLGAGMTSQPLTTLRYFPDTEMNKFCYELGPVTAGRVYLVRATFLHGKYNEMNDRYVSFGLFLEADYWASVVVSNTSTSIQKEAYLKAQRSNVSVCLARNEGSYTPFISSLELRPIDAELIATKEMKKSNRLMFTAFRYNLGAMTEADIRYPDDRYDRIWNALTGTLSITTDTTVNNGVLNDPPPSHVMQTAWGNSSTIQRLEFTFRGLELGTYYMATYFAEIELGVGIGYRNFNITVNGFNWFGPVDIFAKVGSFVTYMVYSDNLNILNSTLIVLLNSTDGSTLGPLWNAFELLQLSDRPANATTLTDDVEALSDVKMNLGLSNWTGDPCLPLTHPYPWVNCSISIPPRVTSLILPEKDIQGSLPKSINSLISLTEINFERNHLSGNIPSWPSLLKLKTLNLKNNHLSGPIPEFLGELPNLVELSLQNNNFSGVIPQKIIDRVSHSGLILNVEGNPNLCTGNSCAPSSSSSQLPGPSSSPSNTESSSQSGRNNIVIIVSVSSGGVIIIALIIILVCCLARRTKQEPEPLPTVSGHGKERELEERHVMLLSYEEIKRATNEFNQKIGMGGFGEVFYGTWKKFPVAVKVLSESSDQGRREFMSEVQILSKVHHRNLVSLVGYCETPKLVLVYEYMGGGSLNDHINASSSDSLPWGGRLTIALDAAQALEYLHSSCEPCIIHGDVKSSNILLEQNMRGKFGDFGLSRLHKDKVNDINTTCLRGSGGYMDPVYSSTGTLNEKSDVYSFGVVLLEIISGRLPIDPGCLSKHERNLADWARIKFGQGVDIESIMDKRLIKEDNKLMSTVCMVMDIAIACVNPEREDRPNMGTVVEELKKALLIAEKITECVSNDTMTFTGSESLYQVRPR